MSPSSHAPPGEQTDQTVGEKLEENKFRASGVSPLGHIFCGLMGNVAMVWAGGPLESSYLARTMTIIRPL